MRRTRAMSTPLRYLLFQIPGWVAAAAVLALLWEFDVVSPRVALALFALWFAKDAAMYPFVRHAYAARDHEHASASLVGERAVVVRALAPRGYVRVRGELWHATSEEAVNAGANVVIVAADAMRLHVRKVD